MVLEEIVKFCRMNFMKMFISLKLQLQKSFSNLWKKTLSKGAEKLLMSTKVIYKKCYRNIETLSTVVAKGIIKNHHLFPVVIEINIVYF